MPKRSAPNEFGGGGGGKRLALANPMKALARFQRKKNTDHEKVKKMWKSATKPEKKMIALTDTSVSIYDGYPYCLLGFPAIQGGTNGNRRIGNSVFWQGGCIIGEIEFRRTDSPGITLASEMGLRVIVGMRKKGPVTGYSTSLQRGQAIMDDLFGGHVGINTNQPLLTNIQAEVTNTRGNYVILKDKTFYGRRPEMVYWDAGATTYRFFRSGQVLPFKVTWTMKNNEAQFQAINSEVLPYTMEPFVLWFSDGPGFATGSLPEVAVKHCEYRQVYTETKTV